MLVETGIIGMFSFIILLAFIFKQGIIVFEEANDPFHRCLCMEVLADFIGLLVHAIGANTFSVVRIMEPLWFVLAMVVMIPELLSKNAPDEVS